MGTVQVHVETPPIPLIKINNYDKSDKYFVKIKSCRYLTLEILDLYEFKMALFYNCDYEGVLLFVCNFNMTLEASGILKDGAKIQCLHMLVRG